MADEQFWPLYIDAVERLIDNNDWKNADEAHQRYTRAKKLQGNVQALWETATALSLIAQELPQLNLAVTDCLSRITEDFNRVSQRLEGIMPGTTQKKIGSLEGVLGLLSEAWFAKCAKLVKTAHAALEACQDQIEREKARLEQIRKFQNERNVFLITLGIGASALTALTIFATRSPEKQQPTPEPQKVTTTQKQETPRNQSSKDATKTAVSSSQSPQIEAPPKAVPFTSLGISKNIASLLPQEQGLSNPPQKVPPASPPSSSPHPERPTTTNLPPDFKSFISQLWLHSISNNPAEAVSDYADIVDYCYSKKPATRSFIEDDHKKLIQRYPKRTYNFAPNYTSSFPNENEANVTYSFTYTYVGSKTASGRSTVSITARKLAGQWKVVKFNESVERNP
jgi:hypothetical protein